MTEAPTILYVGSRKNMLAEFEGLDIYAGKYLVWPYDGEGSSNWDAIGTDTKADMKIVTRELTEAYPAATIVVI